LVVGEWVYGIKFDFGSAGSTVVQDRPRLSYQRKDNSTTEYWTSPDVRGTRFGGHKPIYVLISNETFSGGEELAYDLQRLNRAKLIGETTGGGANPAEGHDLDDWFHIAIPFGRPINPVTKTNWEGVGVVPDIPVPASEALEDGRRRTVEDILSTRTPSHMP
jgi:retinol-binding protein 3